MCPLPLKQRKSAMINQIVFSIHVLILSVEAATKTILYGYEHF